MQVTLLYVRLRAVELSNLDFNLLRTLDALLQETSVTRTAQRLNVTQPAVSAALGKLRRYFDDDLLRRCGNRYELTPLATELKVRTAIAMEGVRRVFETQSGFDPAADEREFTVLTSDYAMAVIGGALRGLTVGTAPKVSLRLEAHHAQIVEQMPDALRDVDGVIMPHGFLSNVPFVDLHADNWVCLVATSNERVGDQLTMKDLAELPWAFNYRTPAAFNPAARQLQVMGIEPHVQIVVASFLALPFVIAGTDRIALVQARVAESLVGNGDVRVLPCPFDAVPITEALWWHPIYDRDPGHAWLRNYLAAACRGLPALT
ncbi:DNA-binding transcriptional LysR family regulator [Actinocorallia herbida]|uniref:DNA-binding transcriptional LysR family regulator n=1 Tax=Actinocorallia herbida TaxID=58109 RepID=A0A3N1D3D6_9ACTN|nr:LysR family transcriptional regulator [Actinocorallia herbida]ROO88057.1 DNA-binding transcriptional LysR family regulator [Actinocorallia herbida]